MEKKVKATLNKLMAVMTAEERIEIENKAKELLKLLSKKFKVKKDVKEKEEV